MYLDPKSDVVFKKIFGQNPDLLKSFLNAIMPFTDDQMIESLEYLTPEQTPSIPILKTTVVDVKCTDQLGRQFIVEMQMNWSSSFEQRVMFGASKAYVQQLDKGQDYQYLCPVYGLSIIDAVFNRESDVWMHHYRMVRTQNPERILKGLELVLVELPKFIPESMAHKRLAVLWLRFLKEIDDKCRKSPQDFEDNPHIAKALELAHEASMSKEELAAYDKYWDIIRTEKTFESDKKAEIKKAREEAKSEGKAEGIENVARNLLERGINIHTISEATGLSVEHLKSMMVHPQPI